MIVPAPHIPLTLCQEPLFAQNGDRVGEQETDVEGEAKVSQEHDHGDGRGEIGASEMRDMRDKGQGQVSSLSITHCSFAPSTPIHAALGISQDASDQKSEADACLGIWRRRLSFSLQLIPRPQPVSRL